MIRLSIDNKIVQATEGSRLIDVARDNGIEIPSLCYNKELPHFSSCMVCMVRDANSGKYIPSCSVTAEDGMKIDTSGEDVRTLRKEAISLLLMEHRAECEAPCKQLCPEGLDIPAMNRLIIKGEIDEAAKLVYMYMPAPVETCNSCSKPCIKGCRRKMIDHSIAIPELIRYVVENSQIKAPGSVEKKPARYSFNSTIGKLDDKEKAEWLKECPDSTARFKEFKTPGDAISEASACMHCDCRAKDNCALREMADELLVKNPRRLRTGKPVEKKINNQNSLIFENAKCIKCGLCVRYLESRTNGEALCFTGRGYMSIISQPLTHEFNEIVINNIDELVNICPTGALGLKNKD
jgi:predicted molibdopterin-dependent oxidoreductase YjgC